MEAEDMEGINDLSAGVVGQKKYEERGPHGSAANFLTGMEMEGDTLGRDGVQKWREIRWAVSVPSERIAVGGAAFILPERYNIMLLSLCFFYFIC